MNRFLLSVGFALSVACAPAGLTQNAATSTPSPSGATSRADTPAPTATPTATPVVDPQRQLGAISALNADVVWVALSGLAGVAVDRTIDGGRTWLRTDVVAGASASQLIFTDATDGWLLVDGANRTQRLFRTTSGGASWTEELPTGRPDSSFGALVARNPLEAWVAETGCADPFACATLRLLRTVDAVTWVVVGPLPGPRLVGLDFIDDAHGWATTSSWSPPYNATSGVARLYGTSDGGRTWRPLFHAIGPQPGLVAKFADPNNGWMLGSDGSFCSMGGCGGYTLYRTSDRGQTWVVADNAESAWWGPTPEGASAAGFLDAPHPTSPSTVWFAIGTGAGPGGGGVTVTHDSGKTWRRYSGSAKLIWSVAGLSAATDQVAWATLGILGEPGRQSVAWTTDGGATWQTTPASSLP